MTKRKQSEQTCVYAPVAIYTNSKDLADDIAKIADNGARTPISAMANILERFQVQYIEHTEIKANPNPNSTNPKYSTVLYFAVPVNDGE